MLSAKLSYTQMGIFALASYPYSLKLLWSPIVDSLYSRRLGRRKSWIVPIQLLTAYLLIACADWIQNLYELADVGTLTWLFAVVVFLMATQVRWGD
jgi:PAT family acetyl-CoA transporter-like MFS transporter 1